MTSTPLHREPTIEDKTREAIAEGHDADIPSNIGFIPTESDRRRTASITRKGRHSLGVEEEECDASSGGSDIVWWDSDSDPHNPYNFPTWRKVMNCALVSALTFVTPLASCTSPTPSALISQLI